MRDMMESMLSEDKGSMSSSRFTMIGSFVLALAMYVWAAVIATLAYFQYGPQAIPDLSWYLYGGTGSLASGVLAYGVNKWSSKDEPIEEEIGHTEEKS